MCNMGKLAVLPWSALGFMCAEKTATTLGDAKTIKQQATVCASVCSILGDGVCCAPLQTLSARQRY
jgi:hypothetical protein